MTSDPALGSTTAANPAPQDPGSGSSMQSSPATTAARPGSLRAELSALDRAIYRAVAGTPTPGMDRALLRLTSAADHSKLWLATAGILAVVGGPTGRRTALNGVAAVGLASLAVNQGAKHASRRARPDRDSADVPQARRVPMPTSTSFPSGHSASAFAFAEGISQTMPWLGVPLRLAATTVAYTRVHAGVHYPGDVVAGTLIGLVAGHAAPRIVDRGVRVVGDIATR